MRLPEFFNSIPPLLLRDPLADLLGAAEAGVIEYRYADAVKLAGHSCPTVAGAWLMAKHGLAALYPDGLPQRGNIRVEMSGPADAGVTGVVASILGLITGAAGENGFKGLGGKQSRRGLLNFGLEMNVVARMTRLDSGVAVDLNYKPELAPASSEMAPLMARVVGGTADDAERRAFAGLWQDRVRRILLEHGDDPDLVSVSSPRAARMPLGLAAA